ncbi:MAG: VWA domain-containing protein [bacterium]|nr:VWA domain-containing protein [bacterium]
MNMLNDFRKYCYPVFLLLLLTGMPVFADSADIIVVTDQSRSITKNLPVVKEYIKKSIFGKVAKEDDTVYIFSFDGKFYFEKTLKGNASPDEIDTVLGNIQAVGMFTDLTAAVEGMTRYIQEHTKSDTRKVVFFLTDGLNDPPAFSPYREGLKHRFFKESKKIVNTGGWSVFVTGIGSKTDAAQVSDLVGAEYVELSSAPTLSEFDEKLTSKLKSARSGWGPLPWIALGIVLLAGIGGFVFYYLKR